MVAQLKSFLSKIRKAAPTAIPGKRTRDEILTQIVGHALQLRLMEYPTTAEEDEKALHDAELPLRARMAVEVRLGEKRLLKEAMLLTGRSSDSQVPDDLEGEAPSKRQKVSE